MEFLEYCLLDINWRISPNFKLGILLLFTPLLPPQALKDDLGNCLSFRFLFLFLQRLILNLYFIAFTLSSADSFSPSTDISPKSTMA